MKVANVFEGVAGATVVSTEIAGLTAPGYVIQDRAAASNALYAAEEVSHGVQPQLAEWADLANTCANDPTSGKDVVGCLARIAEAAQANEKAHTALAATLATVAFAGLVYIGTSRVIRFIYSRRSAPQPSAGS